MTMYNDPKYPQQRSLLSSRDLMEIGVCTVGGAAIGAALMYLFDPETGERRRSTLTDAAGSALESTTESLSSLAHTVRDKASDLGSHVSDHLSSLKDNAGDYSDTAMDAVRGLSKAEIAKMAYKTARDWRNRARHSAAADYYDYARRRLRGEREHSYIPSATTATISGFGALALGFAAWYFFNPFNPQRARERRQYVMDQARCALNETARFARATGQSLRTTGERAWNQTQSMMPFRHEEQQPGMETGSSEPRATTPPINTPSI